MATLLTQNKKNMPPLKTKKPKANKLLLLVNHYVKVTPALQDIKAKFFPGRRFHSVADFKQYFPILDKDNFRKQYPIEALAQSGRLPHAGSFYKSAGTSGHPTLWVESIAEEI